MAIPPVPRPGLAAVSCPREAPAGPGRSDPLLPGAVRWIADFLRARLSSLSGPPAPGRRRDGAIDPRPTTPRGSRRVRGGRSQILPSRKCRSLPQEGSDPMSPCYRPPYVRQPQGKSHLPGPGQLRPARRSRLPVGLLPPPLHLPHAPTRGGVGARGRSPHTLPSSALTVPPGAGSPRESRPTLSGCGGVRPRFPEGVPSCCRPSACGAG